MSSTWRGQGSGTAFLCRSASVGSCGSGQVCLNVPIPSSLHEQPLAWSRSESSVEEQYNQMLNEGTQTDTTKRVLLIAELGWTKEEAAEVRARLSSFEQFWDAPGMDAYDGL